MEKEKIRSLYKKKRKELTKSDLKNRSMLIFEKIIKEFEIQQKTISLFLPIERFNEINTYLILEEALKTGAKVAVPKSDFKTNYLTHILFESYDQLEISSFGILEPKQGEIILPNKFDIVFVPLLAIDKYGNRVGYGKGFYDRFLEKCSKNCVFIGLHLFDQLEEIDNITKNDIRLNFCITPTQIIKF